MPVSASIHKPSASGPRCARIPVIGASRCFKSAVPRLVGSQIPAIPHMQFEAPWVRRSGSPGDLCRYHTVAAEGTAQPEAALGSAVLFAPVHAIGDAPDNDVDEGMKHRQHVLEGQR